MERMVLASQSPRRRELLGLLVKDFDIQASDADETLPQGIAPREAVELLALRKARAVDAGDRVVLGADTVVAIDGCILGKPRDPAEAADMLRRLSGRTHEVYTGVALCRREACRVFSCATLVEFAPLSQREIQWYLDTGEPFDKAGAYGAQGLGARLVRRIDGDFFNVMGLPVQPLYTALKAFAPELL